ALFEDFAVVLTDTDTGTASDTLSVQIVDDVPQLIAPATTTLINAAGTIQTGVALDSDTNIDNNVGADQVGILSFDIANGDQAFNKGGDALQVEGVNPGDPALNVYLYVDGNTLYGSTTSGFGGVVGDLASSPSLVFTLTLNPDGSFGTATDTYDFELHQAIRGEVSFSSADAGYDFMGGNDPYGYFNTNTTAPDILLTPIDGGVFSGSINESANTVGMGDGQSVGANEAIRVDFLLGISGDPSATAGGDGYINPLNQDHVFERDTSGTAHQMVNGAEATFSKLVGTTEINISAWDSPEGDADAATGDQLIYNSTGGQAISTVVITDPTAVAPTEVTGSTADEDGATAGIQVTVGANQYTVKFNGDGTVNIAGIVQGATIGIIVGDGATPLFDSVEYQYLSGSTFKLGDFGALFPSTAGPASFDFNLALTDSDGDSIDIPDGITINLDADPNPPALNLAAPVVQEQPLAEAPAEPVLAGEETAAEGPAIQIATEAVDQLLATDGADEFVWTLADNQDTGDTVISFDTASDALNLKDLLQGEEAQDADLTSYLNVTFDGANTVIEVSTGGDFRGGPGDASKVDQIITLEDVNLVGGDELAAVIQNMLDAGQLIIDQ
ncbi:MAG: type I secretion C-terminal target domain-containing protein, partial [Proteobacteria bacterium]|nr:type I secretion C-terminal target domain-containing protein [Pseudomonadota bacterium]